MPTWEVNSYGYPNPFQSAAARHSWDLFQSFVQHPSYSEVKEYWHGHSARSVDRHTVESWKATFEELGLLYVLTSTDDIVITPGGVQLGAAADAGDKREFAWIGLNLLLRYPLRGKTGRRSRGPAFDQSDLPLYWLLHAALLELGGFWQQELFRVLAHVFLRSQAEDAVGLIQNLRADPAGIAEHPDPSDGKTGAVYNALNQVLVHGSLNHMLFTSARKDSPYIEGMRENWWYLREEFADLIPLALGGLTPPTPSGCAARSSWLERMPTVPDFADERDYFAYAGAEVAPLANAKARAGAAPTAEYDGDVVFLLTPGKHFTRIDDSTIIGPIHSLCVLAQHQRAILSDDLERTYIVEGKQLSGSQVTVSLRKARPITSKDYVAALFEEDADA